MRALGDRHEPNYTAFMRPFVFLLLAACATPGGGDRAFLDVESSFLRSAVHDAVSGHTPLPYYDPELPDTHTAIDEVDGDPDEPDNVLLVYTRRSVPKETWGEYNREHMWPQSVGLDDVARTDLHNLFACDTTVNGDRGRLPFDDCDNCPTHPEATLVRTDDRVWEPPDEVKGDIARALLYMDVRYEGGDEPALTLYDGGKCEADACFPGLSRVLAWHALDPVSEAELARNDRVEKWQNNRNPFVDTPGLVCGIWGGCEEPERVPPAITEIHYDNEGTDVGEGVEISATAGLALDGWTLIAVNGSTGAITHEIFLEGALEDQGQGLGSQWFAMKGLQNGAPDGIALVAPDGAVVERWSWEGTFEIEGALTTDLGVEETSTTPVGHALVRIDGEWFGPEPASPGGMN